MGRQFQVYLLPSDATNLIQELRRKVGLTLLASRSSKPEPTMVESLIVTEAGISRVDCLLGPDNLGSIKLDSIEKQGYWSVNTLFSEVIEFSGCYFDGKTLKRGRFFYESGFYDAQQWRDKSSRFLEWSEAMFRAAKKPLKRISSLDAYVGEDAERWRSAGGLLVALAIKNQPPIIAK